MHYIVTFLACAILCVVSYVWPAAHATGLPRSLRRGNRAARYYRFGIGARLQGEFGDAQGS